MDALETPRELAAVDAAWMDGALRGAHVIDGPRIEKIAIEKIGESSGFLGEIARVHLDYANPGSPSPSSVIVKLPTGNRRLRAVGESMGLYEREILFYTQLAPRLPLRLPRCYFAQLDRGVAAPQMNPRFVAWVNRMPAWVRSVGISLGPWLTPLFRRRSALILEDLGFARLGNQATPGSEPDIHAALASLARIHAECWDDPSVENLPWLHPLDANERIFGTLLARQRPQFERLMGPSIPSETGNILDWLEHHLDAVHRRLARPPCTLIHGDFRLDNLFFDDASGDGQAIVSDWQLAAWGRGVCDLAYFLGSSLDARLPRGADRPYVARYHAALRGCGVSNYDLEECTHDYELALLFAAGRIVSGIGVLEPTDGRAEALLRTWVERAFSRLREIDLQRIL